MHIHGPKLTEKSQNFKKKQTETECVSKTNHQNK